MPELISNEALQPSLLDRLTDRARFLERVNLSYREAALDEAGLPVARIRDMLVSLGMQRVESEDSEGSEAWDNRPELKPFRRVLDLRPQPSAPTLEALIVIHSRRLVPNRDESRDDRFISSRRLRQMVLRDLSWLLNTVCITSVLDLEAYPNVGISCMNFGVPDMTGMTLSGANLPMLAEGIRKAIEAFEPRIRRVTVTPVERDDTGRHNTVAFMIDGELWGQPLPEQLYLQTDLDLETGSVSVREAEN